MPRQPTIARLHDPSDPKWRAVELAQRGRMILDVAALDLEVSEATLGAFHPTTWHFRNALAEARGSWDRLRAQYGRAALEEALAEPPVTVLTLGDNGTGTDTPLAVLVPIAGKTYRVERVRGTDLAPIQWRITHLPPTDDDPTYACRLTDGSPQCDCAEWTYQIEGIVPGGLCKHLAALAALKWL